MKKIVLLLLLILCYAQSMGQKYYTDKKEYESALKYYNDAKDSYENYKKKVIFFNNFKCPKSKSYPINDDDWYSLWENDFKKLNIKRDNNIIRLHSNVIPEDSLYVNFIDDPKYPYLVIKITTKRISKYNYILFCAKTLKFKDPGKPPVYIGESVRPKETKIKKENIKVVVVKSVTIDSVKKETKTIYLMPDGKKYDYENLIKSYPSMSLNQVFSYYFKN